MCRSQENLGQLLCKSPKLTKRMNVLQSIAAALTPQGLLWTVLLMGVAIFLHELAHYALARWQGVQVHSFSIGMGPVIFKRTWQNTEWRLSLLPLGGYVEIDGMVPEERADGQWEQPQRGFTTLAPLGKIAVLLAGPLMNLLLAITLLTGLFSVHGIPTPDRIRIDKVMENSQAQRLGLQKNDVITKINGQPIPKSMMVAERRVGGWEMLRETLKKAGKHQITLERQIGSAAVAYQIAFDWQPVVDGKKQLLGVQYRPDQQQASVPVAFVESLKTTTEAVPQVVGAFGNLIGRFLRLDLSQNEQVSGPIGTAEVVSRAAAVDVWAIMQVAVLLNMSLAFFNLMPIPGLDGGRILLVLVGVVRGKPLSFTQENAINMAGFAFVMLLMTYVIVRDVSRFF